MKRSQVLALAAAVIVAAVAASPGSVDARVRSRPARQAPVVVELFTAQGCTACPQANALLGEFASKKGVIALTFPVDYWDYLGWADTFARPEYTARQRAYIGKLKLREIYTPEVVVDGRREARGFDRARVATLVTEALARKRSHLTAMAVKDAQGRPARVSLGAGSGSGEVWLVRYDPGERVVKVTSGDNKGKTVVQENVVRELVRLGSWSGAAKRMRVPASEKPLDAAEPPLNSVLIVQGARGGPLVAAAAL